MRSWGSEIALAHTSLTPSCFRTEQVRIDRLEVVPMPTTARSNSGTDSCRIASSSVESATTVWVS